MTNVTIIGNATGDAEIKFGKTGTPYATVSVAVTPREKGPDGKWAPNDDKTAFYRVTCFKSLAENVAESVKRGNRVVVIGKLEPREYEHQGERRTSLDVIADHVALDLTFATANATKAQRQSTAQTGHHWAATEPANQWGGQPQQQQAAWGPADDQAPPF